MKQWMLLLLCLSLLLCSCAVREQAVETPKTEIPVVQEEAAATETELAVQDEDGTIEGASLTMSCIIPADWYREENGNYRYDNGYKAAEGFHMELLRDSSLDWDDFWIGPWEEERFELESMGRIVLITTGKSGFMTKPSSDEPAINFYAVRMEHEGTYLSFSYYPKEQLSHEEVLRALQLFLDSITLGELKIAK